MKQLAYYLAIFAVGGSIGYYLMPKKEVIKTVEVQVDRVIREIVKPDGTIERVTTDKSTTSTNESTKLNVTRSRVSLAALVGTNFNTPLYGLAVSKEFLGPITLGAWGLTNPAFNNTQLGISIGVNF